jgi:hypothetical protein
MTVYLVISLPKIPYIQRIYMVLANPTGKQRRELHFLTPIDHISPPTDPIFVIFTRAVYKEYHCNKNGAKRSSSWPGTPLWPISLEQNQQKGCQKGWKTKFHQIRFSASQTISRHKWSTPVVFWGEKRPWVERGGSIQCQIMTWYSA